MLHGIGHLFEGLCNLSSEIVHSVTENSLGISQDEITFSKSLFSCFNFYLFFLFCFATIGALAFLQEKVSTYPEKKQTMTNTY